MHQSPARFSSLAAKQTSWAIMTIHRWLYRSTCRLAPEETQQTVADIVGVSISRNNSLAVTGALLFTGTRFAQYLEGPEASIIALRASILRDSRHQDVTTLIQGAYAGQLFSGWSLAYAGPSRFVADTVDRAIAISEASSYDGTRRLVSMLLEFTIR